MGTSVSYLAQFLLIIFMGYHNPMLFFKWQPSPVLWFIWKGKCSVPTLKKKILFQSYSKISFSLRWTALYYYRQAERDWTSLSEYRTTAISRNFNSNVLQGNQNWKRTDKISNFFSGNIKEQVEIKKRKTNYLTFFTYFKKKIYCLLKQYILLFYLHICKR